MDTNFLEVRSATEARSSLNTTLERFRKHGIHARPMVFGAHRKAEAVVIPFDLYRQLFPLLDDLEIASQVRERLSNDSERVSWGDALHQLGLESP